MSGHVNHQGRSGPVRPRPAVPPAAAAVMHAILAAERCGEHACGFAICQATGFRPRRAGRAIGRLLRDNWVTDSRPPGPGDSEHRIYRPSYAAFWYETRIGPPPPQVASWAAARAMPRAVAAARVAENGDFQAEADSGR